MESSGPVRETRRSTTLVPQMQLCLLVAFALLTRLSRAGTSEAPLAYVVKTYTVNERHSSSEIVLNHMTVDDTNGVVFIGAINRLYQLSMDLEKIAEVETGPRLDSPKCSVTGDCPVEVLPELTDNVNKLLLIDRSRRQLIVCGSLFQGRCEIRSAKNISDSNVLRVVKEGVVANNRTASTVGFIAPGPKSDSSVNVKPQVLYIGVTFIGGNFPYRYLRDLRVAIS